MSLFLKDYIISKIWHKIHFYLQIKCLILKQLKAQLLVFRYSHSYFGIPSKLWWLYQCVKLTTMYRHYLYWTFKRIFYVVSIN